MHDHLSEALWACRNSKSIATGFTLYQLTYDQEAILSIEISVPSPQILVQAFVSSDQYHDEMMQHLEQTDVMRLEAIDNLTLEAQRRARYCNKFVEELTFKEGNLVWKTIFHIIKNHEFGKWSPNWEGPYIINKILSNGAY